MTTFEERTARAAMSSSEIQKFVGDFNDALVQLALTRIREGDLGVQAFASRFDSIAGSLDWTNADLLATAGVDIAWLVGTSNPHRTFMHPDFVTNGARWIFVADYIAVSMASEKISKVLFPNLAKKRRPRDVSNAQLLEEAKLLNHYLHLVQEAGFSGDRVIAYYSDLRTHAQGQNDSGRIGAVGAAAAIRDALNEISPGAVISTYGTFPSSYSSSPADIVKQMRSAAYTSPKALLLSSQRAIILSSDPDVAIVSRIGGDRYRSAEEAADHWSRLRNREERSAMLYQGAFGEVKAGLDRANMHERIALASRERPREVRTERFLLMAILTPEILGEDRRALYDRFKGIFNLYFTWGYDGARAAHPEHWEDFKSEIRKWANI